MVFLQKNWGKGPFAIKGKGQISQTHVKESFPICTAGEKNNTFEVKSMQIWFFDHNV